MSHFLNVIELFWLGFSLLFTLGGNWQPWPPTATSAGPFSPPTGEAAEPPPPTCFRTADVYLWMNVKHLWKWNGFGFHILQENTLISDQDILRVTPSDTTGFLSWKEIWDVVFCDRNWLLFTFFFLSSLLKSNQPFDNHRLLIFSTGIDDNFSQRSWELTSLLRTPSWCRTQLISSDRQIWTFCSKYKDTEFVYLYNCCSWNSVKEPCLSTEN